MASLAEIRAQNPQYNDLSDQALADALHRKFYADMPADEFYKRIGFSRVGPTKSAAATMDQQQAQYLRSQKGAAGTVFEQRPTLDPNASSDRLSGIRNTPLDVFTGTSQQVADTMLLGSGNEAMAGLHALPYLMPGGQSAGDVFSSELARLDKNQQDFQFLNPKTSAAATTAGVVLNPLNLIGGEFINAGLTAPARAGRSAMIGGGAGGVAGFMGTPGDLPQRAVGGAIGAGVGGVLGGAAQPGLELLGLGARKGTEAGSAIYNTLKNQAAARSNPQGQAEKLLSQAFMQDMRPLGLGPAPVNAPLPGQGAINMGGENVAALGRLATVAPGPTRTRAAEFFAEQSAAAPDRGADALRGLSDRGYYGTVEALDLAKQTRAGPLYDEAYAANQNIASPLIDRILGTPAGKRALGKAAELMQNDMSLMAVPDKELTALVKELVDLGKMDAPNTGKGIASGLKLRSLDYVKRALDSQYEELAKAGKKTEAGIILDLKRKLVGELDKADTTGKYAQARAAWAGPSHAIEQVDLGREFYKARGKPADSIREFRAMSPEDQELVRIGFVRDAIEDLGNVGDSGSVYLKLFGNQNKRAVLEALFPDYPSFQKFADQMKAEKSMLATSRMVSGGSPTARIEAEKAAAGDAGDVLDWAGAIKSGSPLRILGMALDKAKNLQRGLTPEVAQALGPMLFEMDPIQIQRALSQAGQSVPLPLRGMGSAWLRNTPAAGLLGQGSGMFGAAIAPQPPIVPGR